MSNNEFQLDKFKITQLHYSETNCKSKCLSLNTKIQVEMSMSNKDPSKGLIHITAKICNAKDNSDTLDLLVETVSLFSTKSDAEVQVKSKDDFENTLKEKCFPLAYKSTCKSFDNISNEIGMLSLHLPTLDELKSNEDEGS